MSEQNKFKMDDLIRKRVEGATMPVSDQMWPRILDARKGRKVHPYGWIGFASLILITSAVAGWMTYQDSKMAEAFPEPLTASMQEYPSDNDAGLANHDTNIADHDASVSGHDADQANHDAMASIASGNDRLQSNSDETHSLTHSTSQTAQNEVAPSSKLTANKPNQNKNASSSSSSKNKDTSSSSTSRNKGEMEGTSQRDNLPASEASGDADEASATPRNEGDEMATLSANQADYPLLSEASINDESVFNAPLSTSFLKKSRPTCYSFNSFLRGLSVDAYLSPEYAVRQLVYKNDDMIDYAALRNDTESYSFAFSAGLRANAHFQGGLAIRAGLVYTDIVEKIRYSDPDAEERSVITVSIDTIYDGPNVIISVDTLSIVTYGEQELVGYNRYRFYDVPIMIGYEIDRGRWIIHINTGLMLNIGTSRRGHILDPESNLVSINSTNANSYPAFRKKVGSSLLMSMGFNYAIRPKVHLLVEPQFRVWTKPLNIQEYPVDQKYINFGLAMGVRQYF